MEYEKIKQLMEDMNTYGLSSLNIELPDGTKVNLSKTNTVEAIQTVAAPVAMPASVAVPQIITPKNEFVNNSSYANQQSEKIIKSPMVGTFYLKPSPTSNPYVSEGDSVKVGQVVCIVEAMKLMNEIESEFAGKVAKVLVEDGAAVEYGTPLFEIQ